MKRIYQKPTTEMYKMQVSRQVMEASRIDIGGKGNFDVKSEEQGYWDIWGDEDASDIAD